jgi:hypothetical protein
MAHSYGCKFRHKLVTASEVKRNAQLIRNMARILRVAPQEAASDSLNLVSDSGKALRHRVVNLMSQVFPLLHDGVRLPLLDPEDSKLSQQSQY